MKKPEILSEEIHKSVKFILGGINKQAELEHYIQSLIQQAKAEVVGEIWAWGEQPCVEHSEVPWPEELGGGTQKRQQVKHRRCQHCWPTLLSKYTGGQKQ